MTASFLPGNGIPQPFSPSTGSQGPGGNGGIRSSDFNFGGSGGSGTVLRGRARPNNNPISGGGGMSADAIERENERRAAEAREARQASKVGQALFDGLDMPDKYGDGSMEYVMSIDTRVPQKDFYGYDVHGTDIQEYTIAAGVEWLRDQAVNNREGYDSLVAELYQAGYLSEKDVRFGQFTGQVAQAFAEAAYDTARANMGRDPGAIITLGDHLDGIIDGFKDTGFGPNGAGGAGPTPPTRVDQWSDPDTLKETIRQSAQAALGRSLSDAEEAAFLSTFHSKEAAWNDQQWAAQQAQFNGQATSTTDRPTESAAAQQYVRTDPKLAQEKAGEDLGSYVGVMNRMMGLGGEGIGIA